jgi:nicotinamide riboside transporter PnuC
MEEEINVPAIPDNVTLLTPGNETSEYSMAANAQGVATVVTVIGALTPIVQPLVDAGGDSRWAIIAGSVLAVLGILSKCLMSLGYAKARSDQKTSPFTK